MSDRDSGTVKILLVDDIEDNLLVLEALLKRPDVELLKAVSGRQALELLLEQDVALALIDVQMPEMDGFELAELMRGANRTSQVPIIFVTAGMQEQGRVFRGYDAGAVDFLFKPIEPRVLHNKVKVFVELYRQRQNLENTLRLNEELIAVVSHDLRNPLNLIMMSAALLKETAAQPQVQAASDKIERSAGRIVAIINDLLDLSRARLGGGIPVERTSCNLSELTRTTVDELVGADPGRAIQVEYRGDLRGHWDGSRLEQVLSNLVANALHHGEPGTAVTVTVDGRSPNEVVVSVHNAGVVPRSKMSVLFQPFLTGHAKEKSRDGLGLGLYIVKQIAIAHGGDVSVTSDESSGTTFHVRLPRH